MFSTCLFFPILFICAQLIGYPHGTAALTSTSSSSIGTSSSTTTTLSTLSTSGAQSTSTVKSSTISATVKCGTSLAGKTQQMYQLYHVDYSDHFYTCYTANKTVAEIMGYFTEKAIGNLSISATDANCSCLKKLYRIYSTSLRDHFYTINITGVSQALTQGYAFDGAGGTQIIEGYCVSAMACGATLPLYRFWSLSATDHFYTTDVTEKDKLINDPSLGFTYEGIECYMWPAASKCGTSLSGTQVPLTRMYNIAWAHHFYTVDVTNITAATQQGFYVEGIMGNMSKLAADVSCWCLRPFYRLYHPLSRDHYYTSDYASMLKAMAIGYQNEGIGDKQSIEGYCVSEAACGATIPIYRFYNARSSDHFYTTLTSEVDLLNSNPTLGYVYEGIECYIW